MIVLKSVGNGANSILDDLGIARLKYPTDKNRVRRLPNPWIVQKALARHGDRKLTREEQREVWDATRTPNKVQWPKWWNLKG